MILMCGLNSRWLPIFLGLRQPSARKLAAGLVTVSAGLVAGLTGAATLCSVLLVFVQLRHATHSHAYRSGIFGAIIVDPPEPLPTAKEFVLVQSEFYLNEPKNGIASFNYGKMLSAAPEIVAFNGRPSQYHDALIRVKRGGRVRFYVISAGPTYLCSFHVVGDQLETVYLGSPHKTRSTAYKRLVFLLAAA